MHVCLCVCDLCYIIYMRCPIIKFYLLLYALTAVYMYKPRTTFLLLYSSAIYPTFYTTPQIIMGSPDDVLEAKKHYDECTDPALIERCKKRLYW